MKDGNCPISLKRKFENERVLVGSGVGLEISTICH